MFAATWPDRFIRPKDKRKNRLATRDYTATLTRSSSQIILVSVTVLMWRTFAIPAPGNVLVSNYKKDPMSAITMETATMIPRYAVHFLLYCIAFMLDIHFVIM